MTSEEIENIQRILANPVRERSESDIKIVTSWLHKNVSNLQTITDQGTLIKLAKGANLETYTPTQIIIVEGTQGDRMFTLLSGSVTVYQQKDHQTERREDLATNRKLMANDVKNLGEVVAVLDTPGTIFGEVALTTGELRSASVVANCQVSVIVVEWSLYENTVGNVIAKEYNRKLDFVAKIPYLTNWNPTNKRQLVVSLQLVNLDYNQVLRNQGDPADGIFYILEGEVCLSSYPGSHSTQYSNYLKSAESKMLAEIINKSNPNVSSYNVSRRTSINSIKERRGSTKSIEVCLIGGNNTGFSCFGDIETILGLPTYFCSATATKPTTILHLNVLTYDRLIEKRNAKVINEISNQVYLRINNWIQRGGVDRIPILQVFMDRFIKITSK